MNNTIEKPKRRVQLELKAGADDIPSLIGLLSSLIFDLDRHYEHIEGDAPYESISGGYSQNHSLSIIINPGVTHDSYFKELNKYLNKENEE